MSEILLQFGIASGMWIELLPSVALQQLTPLSLVALGYLVQKHYVSRPAVFANAIAVNVHARGYTHPPDLVNYPTLLAHG